MLSVIPSYMKLTPFFSSLLAFVVLLVSGTVSAFSQIVPDSIRITFEGYSPDPEWPGIRFYSLADWHQYEGEGYLEEEYESIVIEEAGQISAMMRNLQGKDTFNINVLLEKFGIGGEIDNLPYSSFYTLYEGRYKDKLKWNSQQQDFLAQAMRNPQIRGNCLEKYLSRYTCVVELFLRGKRLDKIELYGKGFIKSGILQEAPAGMLLNGMDLMRLIVNEFVDSNPDDFHNLGWYDYPQHFNNLLEYFEIEEKFLLHDHGNTAKGGKYSDNLNREYVASLKLRKPFGKVDKVAYPNVRILYSVTELDNGLPVVANLHKKAFKVVNKVLNVPFFSNRVEQKGQRLNVWFFNDSNINDYLVSLVADRVEELGIGEKELQRSILLEFPSRSPDMYLLLPDNRIIMLIEEGYRYNYGVLVK